MADSGGGWFWRIGDGDHYCPETDLVLAADITPPEQIKALTDVGLTVYALPNPLTIDDMFNDLRTIAQLTDHQVETERLVADLATRVTAVSPIPQL